MAVTSSVVVCESSSELKLCRRDLAIVVLYYKKNYKIFVLVISAIIMIWIIL